MTNKLCQALRRITALAAVILSWLASAGLWMAVSGIGGGGLVVAGVYLIAGAGWALIAAGIFLLLFATLIFRGMTGG